MKRSIWQPRRAQPANERNRKALRQAATRDALVAQIDSPAHFGCGRRFLGRRPLAVARLKRRLSSTERHASSSTDHPRLIRGPLLNGAATSRLVQYFLGLDRQFKTFRA